MSNKVVVPRFNVPSGRSSWTVRILWGVGGLVFLQMGVFALVVWKQHDAQAAASSAQLAMVAPVAAQAAPAEPVAAPAAAPTAEPAAAAVPDSAKDVPAVATPVAKRERSARSSRATRRSSTKVLAKASPSSKSGALPKPATGKPDALDELLKRFK